MTSSAAGDHKRQAKLVDDLHVHLYGCLRPRDIFELGKDRWQAVPERLAWYEASYAEAWGRRPRASDYWRRDDGLECLERDFLVRGPTSFAGFQAAFNLMIALLPIAPDTPTVLRHVLKADLEAGRRYVEYRCFIPPPLTPADIQMLVSSYAREALAAQSLGGQSFQPRLAFSLSRQPDTGMAQFQALRAALAAWPAAAAVVTGVDFSHVEEGHPPSSMQNLLQTILAANRATPHQALAILYHVGESFSAMSMASAIRWVWQAQALGASRLGHALALGLDARALLAMRRTGTEPAAERRAHLRWLLANSDWLEDHGYTFDSSQVQRELAALSGVDAAALVVCDADDAALADIGTLQKAVLTAMVAKGAIFECCPTSNFRLGQISNPAWHSLPTFLAAGARVVVATDDPGIFATDLAGEEQLCRQEFNLGEDAIADLAATAVAARSEYLVRKSTA